MHGYGPSSYGDGVADVYDDWFGGGDDPEAVADVLAGLAGGPGSAVLELGVGTGRLALPLVARGLAVRGIDASAAMVERLRAKPGGDRVEVTVADMASELPPGPYGLVFVAFNTLFNLTSADAQQRCLSLVAQVLAPGGVFVVDAFVPADVPPDAPARSLEVREVAVDRVVLRATDRDDAAQRAWGQLVEIRESGVRLRPWSIRWATPAQLDVMATAAGLARAQRWGGWDARAFDDASVRHVSTYRRA